MIWKIIASIEAIALIFTGLIIYKKAKYDMEQLNANTEHITVDGKISDKDWKYGCFDKKNYMVTVSHPYGSYTYHYNKDMYNGFKIGEKVEVTLLVKKNDYSDIVHVEPKPALIKRKDD